MEKKEKKERDKEQMEKKEKKERICNRWRVTIEEREG